jgi:type IV pilus assembly protein PilW
MMRNSSTSKRHGGFTLIELMVGMVLALLTTVIIAEVLVKSEGQRRTTSEGSDAQLNGALSLYTLQHDIQMAGYGLINNSAVLGCSVHAQYGSNTAHTFTLAPVIITAGATAADSDTLTVLRGGSMGVSVPIPITGNHANTDSAFSVQSSLGIAAGDLMMALPEAPDASNWCTIFTVQASGAAPLSDTSIPHVTGTTNWNPSTSNMPTTYAAGGTLNKINQLVYRSYGVSGGNLVSTDLFADNGSPADPAPIGSQIVLMKAYYGKDTSGDGTVDTYDTSTPTTVAGWQQIKTIRVAVVARSGQREKDAVTAANPTWDVGSTISITGTSACGDSRCLTLSVHSDTSTDTEWQHYRYKVFDTVIPLRNMLWSAS